MTAVDESKQTTTESRASGRVVRVIGPVVDVEFGRGTIPELNQALTQEARRHPGYERQVIDYYRRTPEAIDNLRAPIFEEKVIDFIVELAKPDERKVTPQELMTGALEEEDATTLV